MSHSSKLLRKLVADRDNPQLWQEVEQWVAQLEADDAQRDQLVQQARTLYCRHSGDTIQVDSDADLSPADEHTWVAGWLLIEHETKEDEEDAETETLEDARRRRAVEALGRLPTGEIMLLNDLTGVVPGATRGAEFACFLPKYLPVQLGQILPLRNLPWSVLAQSLPDKPRYVRVTRLPESTGELQEVHFTLLPEDYQPEEPDGQERQPKEKDPGQGQA